MITRFAYTGAALPGAAATIVLFSTVSAYPGRSGFATTGLHRVMLDLKNSHSGTLKAYQSIDRGTNWSQVEASEAIAAAGAGVTIRRDYIVEPYRDWKLEFVNDGSAQTTFMVNVVGVSSRNPAL